ncbi:MAG: DUF1365 domain-containing protein [Pseudomonadota bacterium]
MSFPAISLYRGEVMHARLQPKKHMFRYRVFSLLLDIDRLEEAQSRLFKLGRFGVMSFVNDDHGARDGSALRPWVEEVLAERDLPKPATIRLHCFPRLWGYVFNPLSVYYCYDAEGQLQSLLYEVKNTFGGQDVYALPADEGSEITRHSHDKAFWVSPFIPMEQTYRFTVHAPAQKLNIRIRQAGPEGEVLIATHVARGAPATDTALLRALLAHPLMTFKVIAGIHYEALRLWLKGVPFLGASDPNAPKPASDLSRIPAQQTQN